jgi:hypothetical protein
MSQDLEQRAIEYSALRGIEIDLANPLGRGEDGQVWKSRVPTAVKASYRWDNYYRERRCYQRLSESNVRSIDGLSVPRLIGFSDNLQVLEIEIVMPPYLLDSGKAYIDQRAPYDEEQLAAWNEELKELFEGNYDRVCSLIGILWHWYRIDYLDAKPQNIMFARPSE